MASLADAILGDMLISEPKRRESQTMAILLQEGIRKEDINHSVWRFFAWEIMTATRAAANNIDPSMARAELAGMPVALREGRYPISEFHKVFGVAVTRRKVGALRDVLKSILEDTAKYQSWENDITALLLDLDKIDDSF